MEEPTQLVLKATVRYIHKVMYTGSPREIQQLRRRPRSRSTGDINPVYFPNTAKFKQNTINEGIKLYNSIDPEMRKLKPKRFKNELKKWILFEQPKNNEGQIVKVVQKLNCQSTKPSTRTKRK